MQIFVPKQGVWDGDCRRVVFSIVTVDDLSPIWHPSILSYYGAPHQDALRTKCGHCGFIMLWCGCEKLFGPDVRSNNHMLYLKCLAWKLFHTKVFYRLYHCHFDDQRKHQSSVSLADGRWIPRKKGQLHGKSFHFMASLWKSSNISIDVDLQDRQWN